MVGAARGHAKVAREPERVAPDSAPGGHPGVLPEQPNASRYHDPFVRWTSGSFRFEPMTWQPRRADASSRRPTTRRPSRQALYERWLEADIAPDGRGNQVDESKPRSS